MLAPEANPGDVRFNLAHSGNMAVLAFARGQDIGVDVEIITQQNQRYFGLALTADEHRHLRNVGRRSSSRTFIELWTRKEAISKAVGLGLSFPFTQIHVLPRSTPTEWSEVSTPKGDSWYVRSIDAADGYAAAIAVRDRDTAIRLFECQALELKGGKTPMLPAIP